MARVCLHAPDDDDHDLERPMSNPQQPELRRSNKGETTQDAQEIRATERDNATAEGTLGEAPAANRPQDVRNSGTPSAIRKAQKG